MSNKYQEEFLDYASKLDALSGQNAEVTKCALDIVQGQDEAATEMFQKISKLTNSGRHTKQMTQIAIALKDSLLRYYGYIKISDICNPKQIETDSRTLSELLDELNGLVGLNNVKAQVNDLIIYQKVQKMREEQGLYAEKNTLHLAFMGNPGTGKTTVARIVGRIYKQIGLLSKGHFMEVARTDLIAGYQGQTALKVKKVIERAKGGVLFIDEAYSITENENTDSYGRECLTELTKALEDYRDDLVVIVAGYTEPMELFFNSNPGLKSRFNTFLYFDDYNVDELYDILKTICQKNNYMLNENAARKAREILGHQVLGKEEHFANGRLARNLYDDLTMNHARRIIAIDNPSYKELSEITEDDLSSLHFDRLP